MSTITRGKQMPVGKALGIKGTAISECEGAGKLVTGQTADILGEQRVMAQDIVVWGNVPISHAIKSLAEQRTHRGDPGQTVVPRE